MSCSTAGVMSSLDLANISTQSSIPNDTNKEYNNIISMVTPGCDPHQLVNADPVSALKCIVQSRDSLVTSEDVRVSPELGQETSHCLSTSRHSSQHQWSHAMVTRVPP